MDVLDFLFIELIFQNSSLSFKLSTLDLSYRKAMSELAFDILKDRVVDSKIEYMQSLITCKSSLRLFNKAEMVWKFSEPEGICTKWVE